MRKWFYSLFILPIFLVGCVLPSKDLEKLPNENIQLENIVDTVLEDKRIYQNDDPFSIVHLYVTILPENEIKFYDLNHWYDQKTNQIESPNLEVIVQEGDEKGPKSGYLGFGEKMVNASLSIRGYSSRMEVQKSYKIKLDDRAGLWRGQTVFNLNKHVQDRSRVKNKLSFDFFQLIPELPSLRTQFVHLYVKDLTEQDSKQYFQSYGLYTHVEQVNERYLSSHGLNPYGNLYKVINFEFRFDGTKIKLEDDPEFNQREFEKVLEIKGDKDHSKLINMLRAVNDNNLNINDIINKYFDRENLLSWLAVNLLSGNVDTLSNNYYLYSPPSSEKWYFIPWDYDKAWGWHTDDLARNIPTWQTGIARYWGTVLHNRFFKDSNNIADLNKKIEELSLVMSKDKTNELLKGYYSVVKPIISQAPDKTYFPINVKSFDKYYYQLISQTEINKRVYYESLEFPMPIFLGDPEINNQNIRFEWENSFHLKGKDIFYTFQLAKDPNFAKVLIEQKNLVDTYTTIGYLEKGQYFWRVLISDSNGHQQIPFDYYLDHEGDFYWGMKELEIE
jgi:spore coat protein H